jgi:DNA-binding NtrC family response regulator
VWPGNVRELRNVIERACILTDSRIVSERELATAMNTVPSGVDAARGAHPSSMVESGFSRTGDPNGAAALSSSDGESALMTTAQREQIVRVLNQVGGNKARAAKQLGMSRRSLYRWIERLGVATQ